MSDAARVRLLDATFHERQVTLRLPFRFGAATVTSCPQVYARARIRLAGEGKFLNRPGDDHTKPIFDKTIRGLTDQYALKFVKP